MKPNEFLIEAAGPKVGRKYQHIEDLVLSDGSHGGLHAVERLRHMGEEGGSIELKWDGMPVVYWGRDEQGNFGMFPKNAWQYLKSGKTETSSGASTVMRSPNDVKAFVMGTGSGDPKARQKFANQFASLWPYFEKISPKQGYLEGGLLFYPGTKPDGTSAMPVLNSKTNTYDFTPNITTFHIPVDSELGKKISKSKVMVAATGYYATMGSSDEQRLPNAESLSVPGVIVQGTTYVQEPVPLDTKGLDSMEAFLKANAKLIDNYLAPKPGLSNPGGELYTYLNKHLRTEGLLADFPDWANANLSAKKAETLLNDLEGLKATLGAVEGLGNQKNVLINQLSQGLHGGIKQTKPEGYVQAHPGKQFNYDMPGQFIKTIDQTNWSPKESVVNEAKAGKKAVVGWGRGMGHTGHDTLVQAVIHQAESTGATPYFVVSRSFGKEDPIPPETKVKMYQKKFPKYAKMFSLPPEGMTTLNEVLANLATKGITDVTLVVGENEKDSFGYLTRPDKSGNPPYKNFGLNSLTVMSRQDTKAPGSDVDSPDYHEGPRATPMREVLLDPNKSEEEQFAVWRQAMSPSLSDQEVLDMMNAAKQNLAQFHTPKPRRKASKIKEQIVKMRPLLKEATVEQRYKMLKLMKEAYSLQEKMKMGATIEPIEEDKEIDPIKTIIQFYKPIVHDIHKEKIDDYVDKARTLLHKTDDPEVRAKLLDIFKKGKENPYIQGGIITTVGALLAGGLLSSASKMGLSPSQTNILLQSVLNTVIPTIVSRINGKSWTDTIKYTLASAGIGTGIAALTEKDSDVIKQLAEDDELNKMLAYAQQHYTSSPNKQQAFMKFVQRSLKHGKEDDIRQDQEIDDLYDIIEKLKQSISQPIAEDDVMAHVAKDLTKGAPIAKLRAARDQERMKKREQDYGHPEAPKFDYLDEK
jgi:hypothetical protein